MHRFCYELVTRQKKLSANLQSSNLCTHICTDIDFILIFLFFFVHFPGEFKYAGQNLAWRGQSWAFEDVSSLMVNSMQIWFNEYELTDQSVINSCCGWNT